MVSVTCNGFGGVGSCGIGGCGRGGDSGFGVMHGPGTGVFVGPRETTGVYFLRNLRFLRVTRPEPSIRMMYWSYCLTSTITPVLSHFVGCGPDWFCTRT